MFLDGQFYLTIIFVTFDINVAWWKFSHKLTKFIINTYSSSHFGKLFCNQSKHTATIFRKRFAKFTMLKPQILFTYFGVGEFFGFNGDGIPTEKVSGWGGGREGSTSHCIIQYLFFQFNHELTTFYQKCLWVSTISLTHKYAFLWFSFMSTGIFVYDCNHNIS